MNVSFREKLAEQRRLKRSVLCVGLDPDPQKLPQYLLTKYSLEEAVKHFCVSIVEATSPFAIAFKLNFAFFEALGDGGMAVMRSVLKTIPSDLLTIADAKRGDIGNSAQFYAKSVFEDLGFDSITLSPYMGQDSITPFLEYPGTCSFVLARTSNPGGSDFQLLNVESRPLYSIVAQSVNLWGKDKPGDTGLVVGATDLDSLSSLRSQLPITPFLIPGVGSQGGSASDVMRAAGSGPVLINSSRDIIYASGSADFAKLAGEQAQITQIALGS
ncbi:MAG: orotidine-5'-phosphate decarboxylase [Bacteroidetes bacterium]|nr:orotidine-5'-phosphate decarboxylase [Bacteroidota bacterium]